MEKKKRNILSVDLRDLKPGWDAWLQANGVKNESAAIRQIITRLVGAASHPALGVSQVDAQERASVRREVALTPSEFRLVEKHAGADGFAVPQWLAHLVRHKVTGEPQFGQNELEALVQSNYQLLALGRNLNQIARALNTNPHEAQHFRIEVIEALENVVRAHAKKVSAVVAASTERWEVR